MLERLTTEQRNNKTQNLDEMTTKEILQVMNEEDKTVAIAVSKELAQIEKLVQKVIASFRQGGRLIYMGAGTSGRLGILDAVECPPTFGTEKEMVQGLIAGGLEAFTNAVEGAEDNEELAVRDLQSIGLTEKDIVIGIAASGRTPYVISGLRYAKQIGAATGSIACNKGAEMSKYADISVEVETGPEILTGSTRLKAGTAQKMVLNMISTASMIGIGKVYKNLMVDVQATNVKLKERAKRIIMQAADVDAKTAERYYEAARGHVKTAIVMILLQCSYEEAEKRLQKANGFVRRALQ
ncbi:N-acetylmuramic acid 6-phosphate etherase [Parageobacillus thermoglucosidasius]|uniref:N-acetylmuramic acid 6-phosphate etherase n=1 Tax=Parageobacillus thermoglucosidasius TaxID=1426 RepID=A0AB38R2I9_PARTM|nr:N-acetylmuramic acid 6-phosphate etherase [Parageobacillus thermoglucosidasius]REK53999.1 MAG: N-acetylmuramic acid 6-phosphate etherase [Geobacillus sp.]AEH48267.1 N-acetylmuramic acid 6-phosphate etherase [Parageobacillus thermoglucosidasius C56-YS93]MBY6269157.1 N-acetylmuramic acid 6-phosphate etherase [Parageobacillus thermoglucosidasius]OUM84187.1 MAG: N-acetylmuramic acid 6-phosphate etherase [Parageobacillus thermoglucosidasius]UOE77778.1 N-acetylmuramic acid 6-phosphate etherase [P